MKLILFVILVVACSLAARTPEQIAKLEAVSKGCRAETGTTVEQINKARDGEFEDDPKLRKHMLCILKKTNLISESGDIDSDAIKTKLEKIGTNEDKITEALKCVVKKDTPEATALDLLQCIVKWQENFSPAD